MPKKALAVGVSGYGFPNDLPHCARDAEAFGDVLETIYRFDDVRVLKDGEATRDAIDRGLEWLVRGATTNDRLVFFFSGHGCRIERSGVIEEALVLKDGRLLDDHDLADRMEHLPFGVLTIVLDCCFSGLDELLVSQPGGQIELARAKRWIPTEQERRLYEPALASGLKAFTPFGHVKPAVPDVMRGHLRSPSLLDPVPARLVTLPEPHARALLVTPCLSDETTLAATSQTESHSPFTWALLHEIKRSGPNRSTIETLQATGHTLRRLGLRQTPLVMQPAQPEHLGLRAFLTFQPVLAVYPSSAPGAERDDELTRTIAEAVRNTFISIKEGRPMHEDIGTIVNTVTPIVASALQNRGYQPWTQPYGGGFGPQGWPGQSPSPWQGGSFGQGGFGQRGFDEVTPIVAALVPAILSGQQSRQYQQPYPQPFFQGFQQPFQQGFQQPFQPGYPQGFPQGLPPYEIAQLVSTLTPLVASLLQSRGYQGHFGQFMPRAA